MTSPTRIVVAGDWHANGRWARHIIEQAERVGLARLLQVGDFGVGMGALGYEDTVERAAAAAGVTIYVVPGNHDNHDLIDGLLTDPARRDEDGFAKLSEHVRIAPQAHTWQWGTRRFASLMGAYSVDQHARIIGRDWWPQEEPTHIDQDRLLKLCQGHQVDVFIGHDIPSGTPTVSHFTLPRAMEMASRHTRELLAYTVEVLRPAVVFGGHWHQRLTHQLAAGGHVARVEVLDMDGADGNAVVLDLESLDVAPLGVAAGVRPPP